MYLAIDIGGTKVLLAVFDKTGNKVFEHRTPTPTNYQDFLALLSKAFAEELCSYKFEACCCALPGRIDRDNGIGIRFGNLPWQNAPVKHDLSDLLGNIPVYLENDAKLAGLSEAILLLDKYKKVLYITIGTGLGGSFIINGILDKNFLDMEPGKTVIEYRGKLHKWEDIVSGKYLMTRYGKRAEEIDDQNIWKEYVKPLALGIGEVVSSFTPEVIVMGGGVGAHLDKFKTYLDDELKNYKNDLVSMPPILQAQRPEEAVIYGCYEYIKQQS